MRHNEEVITGEEAKDQLIEGIDILAEAVLSTMGPMGKTVIISDEYGRPYVTKDGVSVANAIKFKDPVKDIGAQLIKQVAQKTADEAGDGTTTSICLAQSFIRQGLELLNSEVSIVDLQNEIDQLTKETVKLLQKGSRKLRKKDIYKVAAISANNNQEIGKLIQQAYNHSDVVKVEEGKQKESVIETVSGMVLPVSYMSPRFINNDRKQEVNFDEALVLVLDKKLEDLTPYKQVLQYCSQENVPLIIFSEWVSDAVLRLLETNVINDYIKLAVVKAPGFGTYRRDYLADIADFTGATLITSDIKHPVRTKDLGKAVNISVGKTETVIGKHIDIDVTTKLGELKESLSVAKLPEYDMNFIKQRIDNLTGTMAIIKVGGTSEVEMKETKDRVDDAVLAVRSALEEGIIEGGGIALVRAYNVLKPNASDVRRGLLNVLMTPYYQINVNSGGKVNTESTACRFKMDILDPLKVTRCALENAASVAKTILSTEAVVLNESLWN